MLRKVSLLLMLALATPQTQAQGGFIQKPLLEVIQGREASAEDIQKLPVYFTIPDDFVRFRGNDMVGVLLATREDLDGILKSGSPLNTKSGLFRVALSLNTAYDDHAGKFTGEGDPNQDAEFAAMGLQGCKPRRIDSRGVPMLMTACANNTRHLFVLHIAFAHPAPEALKVFYYHPQTYSERDERIWTRFIEGLPGGK